MPNTIAVPLRALAAATAGATGTGIDITVLRTAAKLTLDVPLVTGSGDDLKLTVILETSPDNTVWSHVKTIEVVAAQPAEEIVVGELKRYLRVRSLVAGTTPSFTWGLTGLAHVIYCEPRDVTTYCIPKRSIKEIESSAIIAACLGASSLADGYLSGSFELPLVSWTEDLNLNTGHLAAAIIFRKRGADPQGPDAGVFDAEKTALKWFTLIAAGKLKPPGIVDTTPELFEGGSYVASRPSRGW